MSASINISSQSSQGSRGIARMARQRVVLPAKRRKTRTRIYLPQRTYAVRPTGEKKFFDSSLSTATTAAWAIILNSAVIPTQGAGALQRTGDKLSILSFNFRIYLSMNAVEAQAAPSPTILTRIIIGVSHVGVIAATTDVVDTGATADLLSYYQNSTISDFTILKDFFIKVDPHALNEGVTNSFAHGTSISDVVKFTHTWKKPLAVKFGAGTTNVTRNSIFVMAISSATGATQNVEIRARYLDN